VLRADVSARSIRRAPARRKNRFDQPTRDVRLGRRVGILEGRSTQTDRLLVATEVCDALVTGREMRLELGSLLWLERVIEVVHQERD